MGKRKSGDGEKDYSDLLRKVKKLEKKIKDKNRTRRISSSSNSSDIINETEEITENGSLYDILPPSDNIEMEAVDPGEEFPDLDTDILQILGDDPLNETTEGENLHKDISSRWTYILKNGLQKELQQELLKEYLVPKNCGAVKAPTLNLEIKAALTEINLKKDTYSEKKQNLLTSCIAAIGKALNVALNSSNSQDIIKPLSDAGRLVCNYHYKESQSRRYAIINTLNKQVRDTIKDTKIDEYLFGSDLSEHLKSSKAISKSGIELKSVPRPTRQQYRPSATAPQRGSLNWRGAPRAAVPESRANPFPRRSAPAAAPASSQRRKFNNYNNHQRGRRP